MRAPVLFLVLAATLAPVELRSPGSVSMDFKILPWDVAANVAGYVPVGIVLQESGLVWALLAAASMTLLAETGQLAMMHRDPSVIDVASNLLGAIVGMAVSRRWRIRSPGFRINRWMALVACTLAPALILHVWTISGGVFNARSATVPGTLEAHWKLDESHGLLALDSSGNGLHGRFKNEPKHVAGVRGGAVTFDGVTDWIDFGRAAQLRLIGSMTICAWINPTSHPVDDAAIVSQLFGGMGYQLDTTVDRGPRTIGFKLTNLQGDLMARYGTTPLAVGAWSHVAGVYDAGARTMDVYLNGELDNGALLGTVTGMERSSRATVYVGRRSDLDGFGFAGSIDDVRIYSLALNRTEIVAAMEGAVIDCPAARRAAETGAGGRHGTARPGDPDALQARWADREEAELPGAAAMLGVLVAMACVGFRPEAGPLRCLVASSAAGLLFLYATAPTLPDFNQWMLPILSLAGGASVSGSRQSTVDSRQDGRQRTERLSKA